MLSWYKLKIKGTNIILIDKEIKLYGINNKKLINNNYDVNIKKKENNY